ncbi:MAG: hypothetical protein ABR582_01335 [Gemmatimonadaceae bacterium]
MRLPMKGCVLALLATTSADVARAQQSPIQKGSIQVAGTASLTHERDIGNDVGWTSFELSPRVGYFVVRGLAVNWNLHFRRVWFEDEETITNQRALEWGIGPGLTYYVSTRSRHFYPFLSARTLFTRSALHATVTNAGQEERTNGSSTNNVWLVSGGALYMVGTHVGVTSELFYEHEYFTSRYGISPGNGNSSEMYGLQWGIAAFIF